MGTASRHIRLGWVLFVALAMLAGCGGDDDDDSSSNGASDDDSSLDDDTDDDTDDDSDDDTGDDDTWPPLPEDDDVDDDTEYSDDYVAPWPQSAVEPGPYDESGDAGPLREKAEDFDAWHLAHHQPYYGATTSIIFADDERTTVASYRDYGDSCEWTGLYLGSQSMRYHVTGDPQAKTNALRVVGALDANLRVTQTPGFIARYRAPQEEPIYHGDAWCDADDRCHHVESGEYAGDVWWGGTSRDMYNGWFFGLSLAYDLVDDEDMRDLIREDVSHVLNTLIDQRWTILDETGQPTDAAPNVLPPFRMVWLTIGYHITGEERLREELQKWLRNRSRGAMRFNTISFFNRYSQYYGNCLSHEMWYNLLRLGRVYFNSGDFAFLLDVFNGQIHTFTRLSHNPWFNGVYMGQGGYEPEAGDPYEEQLVQDLTDFSDAPRWREHVPDRDPLTYTLDPVSVFLHDLQAQFPFLADIMGDVSVQADDPFPVPLQCPADFMFQWSPFTITACGDGDPKQVDPGVDYILPYWLASYHHFVTRDQ